MKEITLSIEQIITKALPILESISPADFSRKPNLEKWSKKEILGHLIDSAHNNMRRFIVGQYEDKPHIIYRQDDWVKLQDYQHQDSHDLISLWKLLNKQVIQLLNRMDPSQGERIVDVSQPTETLCTLKYIAQDYLSHLRHHLIQILGVDFEKIENQ